MRSKGTAQQLEERRYRAMNLLAEGYTQKEVAAKLGVTQGAVSLWKRACDKDGREGLCAKVHPGPTPKLTPKQGERLLKYLIEGPRKHGWKTELWTLPRIVELIERKFGAHYDQSGVWRMLRRLGWSCQKPERRARERNQDAVDRWRTHDWPRLKKVAA